VQTCHGLTGVRGYLRGLREWAEPARFHHPQVSLRSPHDVQRIRDQAVVDAHHGEDDRHQQTEPEAGQNEAEKVVADVAISKVHGEVSSIARALRPSDSPLAGAVTIMAPSGNPS